MREESFSSGATEYQRKDKKELGNEDGAEGRKGKGWRMKRGKERAGRLSIFISRAKWPIIAYLRLLI
jgi:hypothetical protein